MPRKLAPVLRRILLRSGAHLQSGYRGADAEPLLKKLGKRSQRQLYDCWVRRQAGCNPANPPGFSTHELRNDGEAYSQWKRGAKIPWWAVGLDIDDAHVVAFLKEATKEGFHAARTYPDSRAEFHHVNFRKPPLLKRLKP